MTRGCASWSRLRLGRSIAQIVAIVVALCLGCRRRTQKTLANGIDEFFADEATRPFSIWCLLEIETGPRKDVRLRCDDPRLVAREAKAQFCCLRNCDTVARKRTLRRNGNDNNTQNVAGQALDSNRENGAWLRRRFSGIFFPKIAIPKNKAGFRFRKGFRHEISIFSFLSRSACSAGTRDLAIAARTSSGNSCAA